MTDDKNFYLNRQMKNDEKIEELLDDLPYFLTEFFYGTSNNTSALTRLNYAYDLRIFFKYVS